MSWAQVEFHDLALGDARRTQRLIRLVDESVGPADREHPAGLRGLAGDQSGLSVAGQSGGGMAGDSGRPYP
ncbi:MAG: hypothetical protein F9K25_15995, partial [Candidatus Contendobacter sp.]